ncbi:MAG: flippase-like domain-containing protein [Candidatus Tectomicrobia bacterium]|nr:flippase-like domain-containing protein [Candidatus Tectomicrobia bacterium]
MKKKIALAVKVGVSLALVFWLVQKMDLGRFWAEAVRMAPAWLLLALLFKSCGVFASILRWKVLLKGQGMDVPLRFLASSFLEGRFFGTFLPSTIGLDTYRTVDLARYSKRTAASISVILVDKIIGLFSLSFLVLVTAGAGAKIVGTKGVLTLLAVFLLPLAMSVGLLLYPQILGRLADAERWKGGRWAGKAHRFVETFTAYSRQRKRLLQAMGLGIVIHLGETLVYYGTALAVGAKVGLADILFTAPLMITATVIPLSIAGIGVREGTFIFFLKQVGVPAESAALLAFLGFLVGGFISLFGGVIFVLRSHKYGASEPGWAMEESLRPEPESAERPKGPIAAERAE